MDELKKWLEETDYKEFELKIASQDASFRKYYRLQKGDETYILMDASLEKESLTPFIDVTKRLLHVGVRAPQIYLQDLHAGYLVIEDFGDEVYLYDLHTGDYEILYKKAIDEIIKMQEADASGLPLYDKEFLHVEMELMPTWYLEQLLPKKNLNAEDKETLSVVFNAISDVVLSQPQNIFVHRDFHSRNLLTTKEENVGIIDYQDAMSGSLTYDLVSLLRDVYIEFDDDEMYKLSLYFRDKKGIDVDDITFIKWFDFMGMQRHIKILGVFSRLYIRDGKKNYLQDIPLTLRYLFDTSRKYDETKELTRLLKKL